MGVEVVVISKVVPSKNENHVREQGQMPTARFHQHALMLNFHPRHIHHIEHMHVIQHLVLVHAANNRIQLLLEIKRSRMLSSRPGRQAHGLCRLQLGLPHNERKNEQFGIEKINAFFLDLGFEALVLRKPHLRRKELQFAFWLEHGRAGVAERLQYLAEVDPLHFDKVEPKQVV
jgi:hypothetical protein